MQVTAQLNYLRIAPRKLRLVAGPLRGLMVENAEAQLTAIFKRGANPLGKLLKSAVKNAENNFQLPKDNLYIKDIVVNEGVKLKRYMPRAQGVAHPIQKKTTHIEVILAEKVAGLKLKNVDRPSPDIATPKIASQSAGTTDPKPTKAKNGDKGTGLAQREGNISTGKGEAEYNSNLLTPDIVLPSLRTTEGTEAKSGSSGTSVPQRRGNIGTGTVKPSALSRVKNASRRFFRRKSI